ncbi:hypothetical protein [Sphingomonas cavernae]|uniref:DUF1349 domain-containing protein n=1 Tax=Sphingomonas cavernae TaxID=2320861 RepID=A0A418WJZ6_9SPHN|nr:hypothetical protein [Sphingomonas cavernae]RJF90340.1 hypothetical protein D3876_08770 [Sphingomonas cavernae]
MRRISGILAVIAVLGASPQAIAQPTAQPDISALNDEFDGKALSDGWTQFHDAFGWPNKIKALDIGGTTAGALHLEPHHSAWVRDLNAPFLFKTVEGDFDVRARVRVRGLKGEVSEDTWSLGGLMARVPNRSNAGKWEPRAENWHFITTGIGHEAGKTMTETKGTYNSSSSLKLRPYANGWVELRLVRVGMALFALARRDANSPWEVRDRFYRMEARPAMQVGLIAYTHSKDLPQEPDDPERMNRNVNTAAPVDMALEVDWIRFSRPKLQAPRDWYAQVSGGNPLANPNLPEAELLAALGG